MTNADRIRAMTDEELAEFMADTCDCGEACPVFPKCQYDTWRECEDRFLVWLKQEVKDG